MNKLQGEIDEESERRAEFAELMKQYTESKKKHAIRQRLEVSDEKIQSLALLMLHYCAGLQHCLDTQEEEKQLLKQQDNDSLPPPLGDVESGDVRRNKKNSMNHDQKDEEEISKEGIFREGTDHADEEEGVEDEVGCDNIMVSQLCADIEDVMNNSEITVVQQNQLVQKILNHCAGQSEVLDASPSSGPTDDAGNDVREENNGDDESEVNVMIIQDTNTSKNSFLEDSADDSSDEGDEITTSNSSEVMRSKRAAVDSNAESPIASIDGTLMENTSREIVTSVDSTDRSAEVLCEGEYLPDEVNYTEHC